METFLALRGFVFYSHSSLTVADHTTDMSILSGGAQRTNSVSGCALLLFLLIFSHLWTMVLAVPTPVFVELYLDQNQGAPLE